MAAIPGLEETLAEDSDKGWMVALTVLYVTGGLGVMLMICRAVMLLGESACCCVKCFKCCAKCCRVDPDKEKSAGTFPHGAGRTNSLLLMLASMMVGILWQWWLAEPMVEFSDGSGDNNVGTAWHAGGCVDGSASYPKCIQFGASLRVSFAQFVFFLAMAMASAAQPPIHDLGWDVKWLVFVALVIGLIWAPSTVFNLSGYAWLARVGAFCFVVLQQLIIVDAAYSFNHYMINCGDAGASGTMTKQMKILLLLCVLGYAVSFVGWVLMYVYYTDDQSNANSTALISVTLCMTVIFTGLQLVSDPAQGHNLFTSSVVATYATYLTYVAVSANPATTHPATASADGDGLGVALGLGVSFLALGGTVYFSSTSMTAVMADKDESTPRKKPLVTDVLTGGDGQPAAGGKQTAPADDGESGHGVAPTTIDIDRRMEAEEARGFKDHLTEFDDDNGVAWRFNVVMAMISNYWAMVVTNWAKADSGHAVAGVQGGTSIMWLNGCAAWICMALYTWTLLAPMLMPDREFS